MTDNKRTFDLGVTDTTRDDLPQSMSIPDALELLESIKDLTMVAPVKLIYEAAVKETLPQLQAGTEVTALDRPSRNRLKALWALRTAYLRESSKLLAAQVS